VGPGDNSTTSIFLRNEARFIQKLRAAKVVRLQLPVYQEGEPIFEFQVGGLDYARYTGNTTAVKPTPPGKTSSHRMDAQQSVSKVSKPAGLEDAIDKKTSRQLEPATDGAPELGFLAYQTKIVAMIRENWAWPGGKSSLRALTRFNIEGDGEITGIKVSESSGDAAFDESIMRALRKSSPLPAPPESHRKDFSHVEMNFKP
jgi:TonB family protein